MSRRELESEVLADVSSGGGLELPVEGENVFTITFIEETKSSRGTPIIKFIAMSETGGGVRDNLPSSPKMKWKTKNLISALGYDCNELVIKTYEETFDGGLEQYCEVEGMDWSALEGERFVGVVKHVENTWTDKDGNDVTSTKAEITSFREVTADDAF